MGILALDCSTGRGSLAVGSAHAGGVLFARQFAAGRGQGGAMFSHLEAGLDSLRKTGEPLAEIVVGLGPGSYSGVRQAIAAMIGLAAGTGARLFGVPSPLGIGPDRTPLHVVADARRGTFYYTATARGVCARGPELMQSEMELMTRIEEHPEWPVRVMEGPLAGDFLPRAQVAWPDAECLLTLPAAARLTPPLEPIYLRPVSVTLPKKPGADLP